MSSQHENNGIIRMKRPRLDPDRAELLARWLFILLSVVSGIQYYLQGNMIRVVSALLTIGLFILFPLAGRLLKLRFPLSFKVIWLLFIIAAMYLGELHNFFYRFSWWDEMVHSCTAMLLTYSALIVAHILSRDRDLTRHLGPLMTAALMLSMTLAFGAVWELFEFSVDKVLGLNLLKGRATTDMNSVYDWQRALENTMADLLMDLSGALAVAAAALLHFRKGGKSLFGKPLKEFIRLNGRLFDQ